RAGHVPPGPDPVCQGRSRQGEGTSQDRSRADQSGELGGQLAGERRGAPVRVSGEPDRRLAPAYRSERRPRAGGGLGTPVESDDHGRSPTTPRADEAQGEGATAES